jgi:hypothetical protein
MHSALLSNSRASGFEVPVRLERRDLPQLSVCLHASQTDKLSM